MFVLVFVTFLRNVFDLTQHFDVLLFDISLSISLLLHIETHWTYLRLTWKLEKPTIGPTIQFFTL